MSADIAWPWGRMGRHSDGEIELVSDGLNDPMRWKFANQFIGVRNDPVIFPDGTSGEYISIHPPSRTPVGGVAILPHFRGELLLCRNFRHAPRRWELEVPRGYVDTGEDPVAAATRELMEEYGVAAKTLISLGQTNADTGVFTSDVDCYWCELADEPKKVGETFKQTPIPYTPSELVSAMRNGEIRDGYLFFCVMSAIARGLISPDKLFVP